MDLATTKHGLGRNSCSGRSRHRDHFFKFFCCSPAISISAGELALYSLTQRQQSTLRFYQRQYAPQTEGSSSRNISVRIAATATTKYHSTSQKTASTVRSLCRCNHPSYAEQNLTFCWVSIFPSDKN
ncbi:uncharacterized protein LOC111258945 [Varroa jacobsoni]|uniref:uncharacterized protein LOC111258945 n=1 Tax=Varroa jacobsoni TaxID=62625 RepID=UPI000BF6E114|nr:uncharacterized protein LOC111258945 [Varroa jacobsoni]